MVHYSETVEQPLRVTAYQAIHMPPGFGALGQFMIWPLLDAMTERCRQNETRSTAIPPEGCMFQLSTVTAASLVVAMISGYSCYSKGGFSAIFASVATPDTTSTATYLSSDTQNLKLIGRTRAIVQRKANDSMPTKSEQVEARSKANETIAHVFGLDNALTTRDLAHKMGFRQQVVSRLQLGSEGWKDLRDFTRDTLRDKIAKQPANSKSRIETPWTLSSVVQDLVLKVALRVSFEGMQIINYDDEAVQVVASEINRLWIGLKGKQIHQVSPWESNTTLRSAVRSVLPDSNLQRGEQNPMNWIVPSYEAIWRVVMLGYLECQHHLFLEVEEDQSRHEIFEPCLKSLRDYLGAIDRSETLDKNSIFPAVYIAHEALRLYPSTKSIYRTFATVPDQQEETHRADIEGLHRHKDIWTDENLQDGTGHPVGVQRFFPKRWTQGSFNQQAYMPFGLPPLQCPAKTSFGPKMITLLIGTLATELQGVSIVPEDASNNPLRQPCALPSGRSDMDMWLVKGYGSTSDGSTGPLLLGNPLPITGTAGAPGLLREGK